MIYFKMIVYNKSKQLWNTVTCNKRCYLKMSFLFLFTFYIMS